MLTRLFRITSGGVPSVGWEPDAGKRHVRICEVPAVQLEMVKIL